MIEDGHLPAPEYRRRLAGVLGVSESYLFGSEQEVEAFLDSDEHWRVIKARFHEERERALPADTTNRFAVPGRGAACSRCAETLQREN